MTVNLCHIFTSIRSWIFKIKNNYFINNLILVYKICKINLATEIKNEFMKQLKTEIQNNDDIDLRKVFPPAIQSVTKLVSDKYRAIFN